MIYVFLADGFEEVEALTPVDYLRRCELSVKTVGVTRKVVTGSHGIPVTADILPEEMDLPSADAVILPGGMPGTLNLEASEAVKDALNWCAEQHCLIGAICAAPSVLGHMGLLVGKKATCFPGFEGELTGAEFVDEPAVRDGDIVTSRGAGTATQFSAALIEALISKERADHLKAGIQWRE